MATGVTVECPGCSAKLKMSDDSKLGKKVKCPKCSGIFVARLSDDEFEDPDNDFERDDIPAPKFKGRKGPAASNKKRLVKKTSSSGGSNVALVSGGAIAVLLLVGIGLYFSGVFSRGPVPAAAVVSVTGKPAIPPEERMLGLRWMPAETEGLLHLKVADLWAAPLLKPLVESAQLYQPFVELQQKTGLTPADIETISIGFADFPDAYRNVARPAFGISDDVHVPLMTVVVRTKKPLSRDQIINTSPSVRWVDYGLQQCFDFEATETYTGWIAEPTTLVICPSRKMNDVISRGESVIPRKELLIIDSKAQFILVAAPRDPRKEREGRLLFPPPDSSASLHMMEFQQTMHESVLAGGLGLNIGSTFDLQTALLFTKSDDAGKAKKSLDGLAANWRKQLDSLKGFAPPALTELGVVLLNSLKIEAQSDTVRMSTSVTESERQKLDQAMSLVPQPPKTAPDPNQSQGIPGNTPQR